MEKTMNAKVLGAASAAVLLAGSGAALAAAPALAAPVANDGAAAAATAPNQTAAQAGKAAPVAVEGSFLFSQEMTTTNDVVRNVFAKASAVLCASLPQYGTANVGGTVAVTGLDGSVLGTVDELAAGDGPTVMVGCACASNAAGGGAIANVGVTGTTLAALLAAVNA